MQYKMGSNANCVILQNVAIMESTDPLALSGCVPCEPDPEMQRIIEETLRGFGENDATAKKKKRRSSKQEKPAERTKSVGVQCELPLNEVNLRCLIDRCAEINPEDAGNFKEIVESCAKFTARLSFPEEVLTDISTSSNNRRNVHSRSNANLKRKLRDFCGAVEEASGFEELEDENDDDCSINKKELPRKLTSTKSLTNPAKDKKEKDVKKKLKTKVNNKCVPKNTPSRIVNGDRKTFSNTTQKINQPRNKKDLKTSKLTTRNNKSSVPDKSSLMDHSKSVSNNKKYKEDFLFYSEKYIQHSTFRKHSLKSISNGKSMKDLNIKKLARNWYKDNRRSNFDKNEFLDPNDLFLHPKAVRRNGTKSLGATNGKSQGEETFCGKVSKSLIEQRKKKRRLYSESQWLNSAEFDLMFPEI